jgi:hypothetical protein
MNPYDLPVEAASALMLSPELYRLSKSAASFVRSAPVTLVPFLRVSATLPPDFQRPCVTVSRHDHS